MHMVPSILLVLSDIIHYRCNLQLLQDIPVSLMVKFGVSYNPHESYFASCDSVDFMISVMSMPRFHKKGVVLPGCCRPISLNR